MARCSTCDIFTFLRFTIYILENIAYGLPSISTSTDTYQGIEMSAKNAVDEDPDTYALTKSETNPQLTVTLADIFDIGHIYINLTIGTVYSVIFAPYVNWARTFSIGHTKNTLTDNLDRVWQGFCVLINFYWKKENSIGEQKYMTHYD